MNKTYHMTIAGCERDLPLCKASDTMMIGAFVIFGDVELTIACARELLKKAPEFDYMVAPEAKAIPLIHEMARQSGRNDYMLVRKAKKLYMDGADARKLRGKKVLILDDVISTGESLAAVETLVKEAGGIITGRMAILAEGAAADRDDIIFLEKLPLFDSEGNPM